MISLVIASVVLAQAAMRAPHVDTWVSPDGHVRIDRPGVVAPRTIGVVGDYFFGRGWRVYWQGPDPNARDGRVVVSFAVAARPSTPHMSAREMVQIGVSRDRRVVATCLRAGMLHGADSALPDQTINGVRYAAASNSDQSMSQGVTTLDLRTVVGGACYAVDRVTETANSDIPAGVTLPQAQAAAAFDAMIATLHITP